MIAVDAKTKKQHSFNILTLSTFLISEHLLKRIVEWNLQIGANRGRRVTHARKFPVVQLKSTLDREVAQKKSVTKWTQSISHQIEGKRSLKFRLVHTPGKQPLGLATKQKRQQHENF